MVSNTSLQNLWAGPLIVAEFRVAKTTGLSLAQMTQLGFKRCCSLAGTVVLVHDEMNRLP